MLLSQLTGKMICTDKTPRGICLGVGVSLKTKCVKYVLCASSASTHTDFAVNVSAISTLSQDALSLTCLRPVYPKNCAKLYIGKPVYSVDGTHLGNLVDVEMQNYVATHIRTDKNRYPFSAIAAVSDAVIIRKEQPYPIGQRIPAPVLSQITIKNEPTVTKSVLRRAIEKNKLITLTLSLAPFEKDNG